MSYLMFWLGTMMAISPCLGFIAERSVVIPTGWNIAPSPENERKVTVEQTWNNKTQVTGIDKMVQTTDTTTPRKAAEETSPGDASRERRSDLILESTENDTHFANNVRIGERRGSDSITSVPRNVLLIFISESGQDSENFWTDFKASRSFPVEGAVQSCYSGETDGARFSLDEVLISGNKEKECDCEHALRSNIAALLTWARDFKGMTTGTLSNANFTIPALFGFEKSAAIALARELDQAEETNVKPEIRKVDWRLIDLGRPSNPASSLTLLPNNREDGPDETMWNVFDMFSRIRTALFRSLLESLAAPEDSIPSIKSRPLRSNLVDMIGELKSLQNEQGFVLVAATSVNEINSVMDIIQREVSEDTLLVMAGMCSQDGKPVPFVAQGPSSKILHETTTISDLLTLIKNIMSNGCRRSASRVHRQDALLVPGAQLDILPQKPAVLARALRNAPDKSDNVNKTDATGSKDEVKQVTDSKAKDEAAKDDVKSATQKLETRSSKSDFNKPEKYAMLSATLVSIVAMFALTA